MELDKLDIDKVHKLKGWDRYIALECRRVWLHAQRKRDKRERNNKQSKIYQFKKKKNDMES